MSQSTFDEDELFGEAASEMKTDVREALDRAEEALPSVETLENADGATLSEILDSVTTAIQIEDVEAALQEAQKQYTIGTRADAFDEEFASDVESKIEDLQVELEATRTIETASAEITEALTELENPEQSEQETAEAEPVDDSDDTQQ